MAQYARCLKCKKKVMRPAPGQTVCRSCGWTPPPPPPPPKIRKPPLLSCAGCGKRMQPDRGSLPQGAARCRACRGWTGRTARPHGPCADCGAACQGTRCRRCDGSSRRVRPVNDPHITRSRRATAAPGLRPLARAALLHKWMKAGARCRYCGGVATTIDHVVPLVRGGSNHEGNLAPACRTCNSSKGALLVVEWMRKSRALRACGVRVDIH